MKRYWIALLVVVLAACGGGGQKGNFSDATELAGGPQHGRRLAGVGNLDQTAQRRERNHPIRHRPGHPGGGAADALARGSGHRRLARTDRPDEYRPAAFGHRRLEPFSRRSRRRGPPLDRHPPEFMALTVKAERE